MGMPTTPSTLYSLILRAREGYNMGYRLQVMAGEVEPKLTDLLAEFQAVQTERAEREDELEELDNGRVCDAETRRDILDGWTEAESEIAHKLVALLRGEGK